MAISCVYEERNGDGSIVSTGRLTLEQPPAVGDVLQLGGRELRVTDVLPSRAEETRLLLERP
jgi:hypothetical protein